MAILKYKDNNGEWKEFYAANDGVTFLPSIDPITGILSWDNNGHLDNPEPISLLSETVVMKDYKTEFPAIGNEYCIYIEKASNSIYRYDMAKNEYIPLSTNPSAAAV